MLGLCTTFISLAIWTLSTRHDGAHLDTAQRFTVNGRKEIWWQQGDENALQKVKEMRDKNLVSYRGSYAAFIFSPCVAITR
jgi:hypothetical protein